MATISKYAAKKLSRTAEPKTWFMEGVSETKEAEDFADLGILPKICAEHILKAVEELKMAGSVAAEMERKATGVQIVDPRGIGGACRCAEKRFKALAKRAERIA